MQMGLLSPNLMTHPSRTVMRPLDVPFGGTEGLAGAARLGSELTIHRALSAANNC